MSRTTNFVLDLLTDDGDNGEVFAPRPFSTATSCGNCGAVTTHPITATCEDCQDVNQTLDTTITPIPATTTGTRNEVIAELAWTNAPGLILYLRNYTPIERQGMAADFAAYLATKGIQRTKQDVMRNWNILIEYMPWEDYRPRRIG